ncbi:hypothetical protein phi9181_ORF057 [Enterococcus phage 9181]|nr:hypothetical protein phi9181_ORF057 [Enterococcus phage 9181]
MKKLTKNEQHQNAIEEATQRLIKKVNDVINSLSQDEKFYTLLNLSQQVNSYDCSLDTCIEPISFIDDYLAEMPFLEALQKIDMDNFDPLDDYLIMTIYGIESADEAKALEALELIQDEIVEGTILNWEHIYYYDINENIVNLINKFYELLESKEG